MLFIVFITFAVLAVVQAAVEFDFRTQWPACVGTVQNTQQCEASWAMAVTSTVADRACIAGLTSSHVPLSSQYLLDCDLSNKGCQGGSAHKAWAYTAIFGVVTESCYGFLDADASCPTGCTDGSDPTMTYVIDTKYLPDVAAIQAEIQASGPVTATMAVYDDLVYDYTGGVYYYDYGNFVGNRAVKIVGWGTDDASGTAYWIVENFWGASWGESGYFKIRSGTNECGIESSAASGTASTTAWQPEPPDFGDEYYAVFVLEELGMKQGTEMWIRDGGNQMGETAFAPGIQAKIAMQAGVSDGWMVQWALSGGMEQCICMGAPQFPQDLLNAEGIPYERSYWSGVDVDDGNTRYILTDYRYKVGDIEDIIYTFANVATPRGAYPWALYQQLSSIVLFCDFQAYERITTPDDVYVAPCTCPGS